MQTYGQQLRALRLELKLSQEAMAKRMGYARQANLSLYENDRKIPNVQTVIRHARACGVKPSQLLKDVVITDYDRVRAGEYDNVVLPKPTKSQRRSVLDEPKTESKKSRRTAS